MPKGLGFNWLIHIVAAAENEDSPRTRTALLAGRQESHGILLDGAPSGGQDGQALLHKPSA